MKIQYLHASRFGNGARVAEEFRRLMDQCGIEVTVSHVKHADGRRLPPADLYVFSSPGRFGGPIGGMRRFLKKAAFPSGARYALVATELRPASAKNTLEDTEPGKCQRVIPAMTDILQVRGLVKMAECKIFVTGMTGPLEAGWESKVADLAATVLLDARSHAAPAGAAAR